MAPSFYIQQSFIDKYYSLILTHSIKKDLRKKMYTLAQRLNPQSRDR